MKKRGWLSIKRGVSATLLAVVLSFATFVAIPSEQAGAAIWDNRCYSSSRSCGYFYGGYWRADACGAYLICGGIYGIGSVSQFVATMKGHNRGASAQNRMGAAFIVHTLLGRNGDQANAAGGIGVSDADFTLLEQRLNALPSINWNATVCSNGIDTMAVRSGTSRDVLRNPQYISRCEAGIEFFDGNGHSYKIFKRCANPVGSMDVLTSVNFTLNPTMGLNKTSAEGGETATLDPSVSNAGTTASTSVDWRVTTFRVNQGGTVPNGAVSTTAPLPFYGNNAADVTPSTPGQSQAFARGVTSLAARLAAQQIGDFPVGTRVCYALSVRPYTHSDANSWRHSTPACVVIAKKPKVQVKGSDVIVGKDGTSNITTSSSTKTVGGASRTFGSWGEYGIMASGQVTSMASGAGYSGGAATNTPCSLSLLTFSNVRAGRTSCVNGDKPGGYTNVRTLPDIGSRLVVKNALGANPSINISNTQSNTYGASGTVTVNSSAAVPVGRWVVINAPTATVNITSNIQYTGDSLDSLTDIPQVVIIANRINIAASVTRVDAWLIATGAQGGLYTCSDVPVATNLNSNVCNQQLVVNGPVVARHIYLHRTAGSDGTSSGVTNAAQAGRAAEVFNLRPDAYLWATGYTAGAGRLQTVITKELPPLF